MNYQSLKSKELPGGSPIRSTNLVLQIASGKSTSNL